jgi:hypothetical protein
MSEHFHATAALPRIKRRRYPPDGRMGGYKRRSGRCGVEANVLSLPGIERGLLLVPTAVS